LGADGVVEGAVWERRDGVVGGGLTVAEEGGYYYEVFGG
jgi:hypothetical protein